MPSRSLRSTWAIRTDDRMPIRSVGRPRPLTSSPASSRWPSRCRPTKPPMPVMSARTALTYPLRPHIPRGQVPPLLVGELIDAHAETVEFESGDLFVDVL